MKLVVLSGPMKHAVIQLTRAVTTIGRSVDADITLAGDLSISRKHCRLVADPTGGFTIEDLRSNNGTWLAGRRLAAPTPLPTKVEVRIAETRICLIDDRETTIPTLAALARIDRSGNDPHDSMVVARTLDPRSLVIAEEVHRDPFEIDLLLRRLKVFQDVSEVLVGKLDGDDVLRSITKFLLTVTAADRALALRRDAAGNLNPVAASYADSAHGESIHLSQTLVARVEREKLAILVQDTMADGELRDRGSIQLGLIRSAICAPLLHQGKVKAIIQLDANAAYCLGDEDLQTVSAVANQAAIAVANSELYDELRTAQSRLVRTEKLATLGELAESIAHDIGNVLTPIAGFSIQLKKHPDIKPALKDAFDRAVRRLNSLTRQLLALGRPKARSLDLGFIDLNETVTASAALLDTEARHQGVTIRTELAPDLPRLIADGDRLDQVFVNLSINACHAMAEGGGELVIRTRAEEGAVVAEFTDTGAGIPAENLERIFEAFFTTKGDKGTGLGLHSCKRIVEEEHGGKLTVKSELGRGTTFSVRLPVPPLPASG